MEMDLFRHNHARFVGLDPVDAMEMKQRKYLPNFDEFVEHVHAHWMAKNANNGADGAINFRMV